MGAKTIWFSLLILFLSAAGDFSRAATLSLPAIVRGWYQELGERSPTFLNYALGVHRSGGPGSANQPFFEYRNFFIFDLAGMALPIGSAELVLYLPTPLGYASGDPSETFELHDVVTRVDDLINGIDGVASFADLGDGAVYGSRTITAADQGAVIKIQLSAVAIADLNSSHSRLAIGGKLTTLDLGVTRREETVFGSTNSGSISELRLTLIPEPTSIVLLSLAAVMLGGSRLRTRRGKSS